MILRSSSTPVLGSLISSIADSPNHNNNSTINHYDSCSCCRHYPSTNFFHHSHGYGNGNGNCNGRLSCHPSPASSLHLSTTVSCGSSPAASPFDPIIFSEFDRRQGIRRAQSEGNLDGLLVDCSSSSSHDRNEHHHDQYYHFYSNHNQPRKLSATHIMLQTIPSFSFYNSMARCEEEDDDESDLEEEDEEEEWEENEQVLMEKIREDEGIIREKVLLGDDEGVKVTDSRIWNSNVELIQEELGGQEMFLARGLGIGIGIGTGVGVGVDSTGDGGSNYGGGGGGGRGGGEFNPGGGGDNQDDQVEEYYKRMVEENPANSLFLANYAHFLYERKRDVKGAEEYYGRAILADSKDGETLSQYAKLVWEVHGDQERASTYYERAVQASPQDSHVHAAYASFLWETEEDGDECAAPTDIIDPFHSQSQFHAEAGTGTLAAA